MRTTFRISELNQGVSWRWAGPFLWLTIDYDHRFRTVDAERTEIEFAVDGEGIGVGVFGRIFAAVYAVNLDRAIPLLVAEIERRMTPE